MRKIMLKNLCKPLIALSLGLNLAFVAMWLIHSLPDRRIGLAASNAVVDTGAVYSALHREIGVTEEQWKQIEPLIQDFREKAGKRRQMISSLRGQLMDLLIMTEMDEAAIRSKQEEILIAQGRMQNLVMDHLLKEKELLSQDQAKKLIQCLREQCRNGDGMVSGKGVGRFLYEHSRDLIMDNKEMERR
jgi:hypothetical protein